MDHLMHRSVLALFHDGLNKKAEYGWCVCVTCLETPPHSPLAVLCKLLRTPFPIPKLIAFSPFPAWGKRGCWELLAHRRFTSREVSPKVMYHGPLPMDHVPCIMQRKYVVQIDGVGETLCKQ